MSLFKESVNKTATIKALPRCLPTILMNPDALIKMQLYVENCSEEVGWLGTAFETKTAIYIDDVFLFDQEVHSTTTEITPDGLAAFGEKILQEENGMEIWNNLKVWGHSHVNMSVSPSGQDDNQMETFVEGGHDFFIRIIANKKGDIRIDLYNYKLGVIYNDMPWYEAISAEEAEIREQIKLLNDCLETIKKERATKYEKGIKKEIEEKVKKKSYTHNVTNHIGGKTTTSSQTSFTMIGTKEQSDTKDSKKNETKKETKEIKKDIYFCINEDDDVYDYFTNNDLLEFSDCKSLFELKTTLRNYGYANYFYSDELVIILDVAQKYAKKYLENSAMIY